MLEHCLFSFVTLDDLVCMHQSALVGCPPTNCIRGFGICIYQGCLNLEGSRLVHPMTMNDMCDLETIYSNVADSLQFIGQSIGIIAQFTFYVREYAIARALPYVESLSV